ncbi:MAG TPA: division/cell wall cluster transcriptional repressor MraZ [Elusimicrobia bacterium]|nr:division/cell wall cluster transcriptional repressor MraZ [Elusimicrobiota bacterium]
MFVGLYEYSVDSKGRIFIPSKFRRNNHFIITIGLDECLYAYPKDRWGKLENKLDGLPFNDKSEERAFKRVLLSGATELKPDSQGRILIPYHLRNYAKLKNDVIIIGVSSRIEIWSKSIWEKYNKNAKKLFFKHVSSLEI